MRNIALVFALLCLTCGLAAAQNSAVVTLDQWKVYGAYQYTGLDSHAMQDVFDLEHQLDPNFPLLHFGDRQNLNGWSGGIQEDVTKWFGVVADVGGSYGERRVLLPNTQFFTCAPVQCTLRSRMAMYTITGGPQFTLYRGSNFQPFVHFLVGGGFFHTRTDVLANNVPEVAPVVANPEGFVYGGGLGTDFFFARRAGVRVAVDLLRTPFFSDTQNQIRGTAGLVFRF